MEFLFKKTNALSVNEKKQICALFKSVFQKDRSLQVFDNQFLHTVLGYSYHGLMIDEKEIVGSYTVIPFKYIFFGQECLFALSVDTMIDDRYRGVAFNLRKMAKLVYNALIEDEVPFVFGFPNANYYLIQKKILGWTDIGELDFYVLPINIGAIINQLRAFNVFSVSVANLINKMTKEIKVLNAISDVKYNIEKINDNDYLCYRYDQTYKTVKIANESFLVYKIITENNIRVAYLIDVYPLDKRLLEASVKYIFENEKDMIDVIMYVGKLKFKPTNLFKVPKRFEPKRLYMSGKILMDSMIDKRIYAIDNWNINLSNYDVR